MAENKYYERKIKYLDLLENGERIGGAGFVKTEVRGADVSFAITVKGLHPTDTYEREVMLQDSGGESAVGRISLKKGQGQFAYHAVVDYSQLRGIRIVIDGAREISCRWQEEKKVRAGRGNAVSSNTASGDSIARRDVGEQPGPQKPQKPQKSQEIQVIAWDEIKAAEESLEKVKKMMSKPAERETGRDTGKMIRRDTRRTSEGTREETEEVGRASEETGRSSEKDSGRTARGGNSIRMGIVDRDAENADAGRPAERRTDNERQRSLSGRTSGREKRPVRLMEDKWQQIWAIYPHIQPFQDEREYLSISPADFVLLSGEAYRAANNSFLLHGYYNYDHLILTRIEKRGEVTYYIGVPGNYYEREKQVAVMFGFESFECGTEPAQAGDFGYYMMRTQL